MGYFFIIKSPTHNIFKSSFLMCAGARSATVIIFGEVQFFYNPWFFQNWSLNLFIFKLFVSFLKLFIARRKNNGYVNIGEPKVITI